MRALISTQTGGPETLVLGDLPRPQPKAGEIRIRVRACGVNYPDTLMIEDKYQFQPARPFAHKMFGCPHSVACFPTLRRSASVVHS